MTKKNRPKLTLKPDALAWLAANCPADVWLRVIQLFDRKQYAALFSYLQQTTAPEIYRQFEEHTLEPEVLAERRKAEAAKKEAEMIEARTIGSGFKDIPPPFSLEAVMSGKTWTPLVLTKDKEAAEEAQHRRDFENFELSLIEEPTF